MGRPRTYPPICTVDGCTNKHMCRGFCNPHYYQWRKAEGLEPRAKKRIRTYTEEQREKKRIANREYARRPTSYAAQKVWREQNPEAWAEIGRRARYKAKYGITIEDYDRMLAEQGGACAICRSTDPKGPGERFAVDHCHESGAVRALLCAGCNTGLGMFGDDLERLRLAVAYLAQFTQTNNPEWSQS